MPQFRTVAEIRTSDATARVYEFGWQSWTPTTAYTLGAPNHRPQTPARAVSGYRPETPKPAHAYQGDGLLAVQGERDGPVTVVGTIDGRWSVPTIRADVLPAGGVHRTVTVSAETPVEVVVDGGADGIAGALARYADRYLDRVGRPQLRPLPPMWASWYHYFTKFTEADLLENLDAMDRLELDIGVVRLDDAFQAGIGDWLELSGGFTSLPRALDAVRARGRTPGLWIAPLLVGEHSRLFEDHPDWVVRTPDGSPTLALHNWGQDCYALDITHPDAATYIRHVLRTWVEYGMGYLMVDFMFAGALRGVRYDRHMDAIPAYRVALTLIRDAIGPEVFLQGCGAPMFPSIGLVDTMRVGPDVDLTWAPAGNDFSRPGLASALVSSHGRAFTHGRFWVNDADCFMLRPGVERRGEWAEAIERYSAARISSDRLAALDDWGLMRTRELLVPGGATPFLAVDDDFTPRP
ncbi:MAG: glycoside hydrolase family 36 protein [Terracoccus sp.]